MRLAAVTCLLFGCGRVAFEPREDGTTSDGDAAAADALDVTTCDESIAGLIACESFEGQPQLPMPEFVDPGFVIPDTTNPYRGARSLHSYATRINEPAWLVGTLLPNMTSGELDARWYVYVPASPQQLDLASVHLIERTPPFDGFIFGFRHDSIHAVNTTTEVDANLPIAIARERWVCIQVRIVIHATQGSIETWIDGVVGPAHFNTNTLPGSGYQNVHAGMYSASMGMPPVTLFTDELVLATSPIACD